MFCIRMQSVCGVVCMYVYVCVCVYVCVQVYKPLILLLKFLNNVKLAASVIINSSTVEKKLLVIIGKHPRNKQTISILTNVISSPITGNKREKYVFCIYSSTGVIIIFLRMTRQYQTKWGK